MTRVWRISKREFAATAFNGDGAASYPGRWNSPGTRVVYTSETKSLAALELLVGLDRHEPPPGLVCFGVDIPDGVSMEEVPVETLPSDWNAYPSGEDLQRLGSQWAQDLRSAVLVVPSAQIPSEHNFILNPEHPEFRRLVIGEPEPFEYDTRLLPAT